MVSDSDIETHADPVWRSRTNFIIQLDLTPHGLPGRREQCWARTNDRALFEMCCIPYFTYGISLGDTLQVELGTGAHQVIAKSGRRTIRLAFTDDAAAHAEHNRLHDILRGHLGCLVEFRDTHYAAIDITDDRQEAGIIDALTPLSDAGKLLWEWADPAPPED